MGTCNEEKKPQYNQETEITSLGVTPAARNIFHFAAHAEDSQQQKELKLKLTPHISSLLLSNFLLLLLFFLERGSHLLREAFSLHISAKLLFPPPNYIYIK